MCILCSIQKWSRQMASLLPWLAVPLVALSAISQFFLPPANRFEPTSPRLACVIVLLASLFWYDILLPKISLWRSSYSERSRQLELSAYMEQERRRRSSTRYCRNCNNPYRDQNPPGGGGRFMCSHCGHVSKRPKLDLHGSHTGALRGQSWMVKFVRTLAGHLTLENLVVSLFRLISCIFSYARCACNKVANFGSLSEDGCLVRDGRGFRSRRGDNGDNSLESKEEKARRKAEEKRQARLEREMLEEEERKQREEVARLVEEQRKLRDEMLEAERESIKRSQSAARRDSRKGAEKRRQEGRKENDKSRDSREGAEKWRQAGRKENDKSSSKSTSDGEETEKRTNRQREGNLAHYKRSENERWVSPKHPTESQRSHPGDRVKGYFRSSFRGSATRATKPANGCVDQRTGSGNRNGARSLGYANGKVNLNGHDRKIGIDIHRPVEAYSQPRPPVQKKSWLQLFTRSSSAVSPCPDASATTIDNKTSQLEVHNVCRNDQRMMPSYSLDNHIGLGQLLPFSLYPSINFSFARTSVSLPVSEDISPWVKVYRQDLVPDDLDIFEDPCFVPDPVALLGPVSESLDSFPLDLRTGFISEHNTGNPHCIKNAHVSSDISRPSPIESPLSRQRVLQERHSVTGQPSTDLLNLNMDESSNTHEPGTWQMWGTPLAQDGLGLIAGANWLSQPGKGPDKSYKEDSMQSLLRDPIESDVRKENHVLSATYTPQRLGIVNYQNGGICSPVGSLPDDNDTRAHITLNSLPVEGDNVSFPLSQMDSFAHSPVRPSLSVISKPSQANCWSRRGCSPQGPQDVLNSLFVRPLIGGPFLANPDI